MTSDPIREAADDALSDVAQAVRGLYGPRGHDVVIMHGGTALITNAASAVIAEACRERAEASKGGKEDAAKTIVERWLVDIIERHATDLGDGGGALCLMLHAGWQAAMRCAEGSGGGGGLPFHFAESPQQQQQQQQQQRRRRRQDSSSSSLSQRRLRHLTPAAVRTCSLMSRALARLPSTIVADTLRMSV